MKKPVTKRQILYESTSVRNTEQSILRYPYVTTHKKGNKSCSDWIAKSVFMYLGFQIRSPFVSPNLQTRPLKHLRGIWRESRVQLRNAGLQNPEVHANSDLTGGQDPQQHFLLPEHFASWDTLSKTLTRAFLSPPCPLLPPSPNNTCNVFFFKLPNNTKTYKERKHSFLRNSLIKVEVCHKITIYYADKERTWNYLCG